MATVDKVDDVIGNNNEETEGEIDVNNSDVTQENQVDSHDIQGDKDMIDQNATSVSELTPEVLSEDLGTSPMSSTEIVTEHKLEEPIAATARPAPQTMPTIIGTPQTAAQPGYAQQYPYVPMPGFMNPFVAPYMPQGLPTAPFQPQIGDGTQLTPGTMPPTFQGQQPPLTLPPMDPNALGMEPPAPGQPQGGVYLSTTQYQEMMQQYLQALLYQAMATGNPQPAPLGNARGLSPASENGQVVFDDTVDCADSLKKSKLSEGHRQRNAPIWLQQNAMGQAPLSHESTPANVPLTEDTIDERENIETPPNDSNTESSPEKIENGENSERRSSQSSDSTSQENPSETNRKKRASELINKQMAEIDKEIHRRSQNQNIKKIEQHDVEALLNEQNSAFQQFQQAISLQQNAANWDQSSMPWAGETTSTNVHSQFEASKDNRTLQEIQTNAQFTQPGVPSPYVAPMMTAQHFPQANLHTSAHAAHNSAQQTQTHTKQPAPIIAPQVLQQGSYPTYLPQIEMESTPPQEINSIGVARSPETEVDDIPPRLQGLPAGQIPPSQAAEMLREIQSGRIPEAFLQQQSKEALRTQTSPEPEECEWGESSKGGENNENTEQPVWQYRQTQQKETKRKDNVIKNGTHSYDLDNSPREKPTQGNNADSDTDNETDRLLGQGRFGLRKKYQKAPTEDLDEIHRKKSHNSTNISQQNSLNSAQNGSSKPAVKKRNKEVFVHEPAVLIEGVLFRARYLGSTQIVSEGRPNKATRMMQANEAVARIKAPEGEPQPSTEVDLFISTEKIMVLNTDLQRISDTDVRQDIMMDHPLRTISYIADIGDIVVLMARRVSQGSSPQSPEGQSASIRKTPKIICHVFESDEAQFIAQSIAQAFQVAYLEFLRANGIEDPGYLRESDYQDVLNAQEIFGEELEMFANKEKQKDVVIPKAKDEILGLVIVESGWGSMLPAVMVANLKPGGSAARCNQLNIGDQIIAVNGISLVGLPLITCQTHVKNCRGLTAVKLTVVPTPPVVEVKIRRPDSKYQLGFSVQNGVICSLLRGGIAERGGIRVGHRIIEINEQSVVAVPHERIVNMLATAVGEIHMKTMPTSMFRLLTGQEQPNYI